MALRSPLRPILLRSSRSWIPTATGSTRSFFLPGLGPLGDLSTPQVLTASRALPYPSSRLFGLIADVDSYSQFVPYCQQSRVTHWRTCGDKKLPTQADLHIGWGAFEEVFTSHLVCDPDKGLVEARSGKDARSVIQPEQANSTTRLAACAGGPTTPIRIGTSGSVFASLVTRWAVKPVVGQNPRLDNKKQWSQVDLCINFQFTSPLYAAVSMAASDRMAGVMIEAFEKQAQKILGPG